MALPRTGVTTSQQPASAKRNDVLIDLDTFHGIQSGLWQD
jgi:hypothetical protein